MAANDSCLNLDVQRRQPLHDLHRLKARGDDTKEEFERVLGVVHRFGGPEVGVVLDAAVFVFADRLAFHDPFEGGFAVDDVVVGFFGDVADRKMGGLNFILLGAT